MKVVYLTPRNSYREGLIRAAIDEIRREFCGEYSIGGILWISRKGAVLQDVEVVNGQAVFIRSDAKSKYNEDNDSTKNSHPLSKLEEIARRYKLKVETTQVPDREEQVKKVVRPKKIPSSLFGG